MVDNRQVDLLASASPLPIVIGMGDLTKEEVHNAPENSYSQLNLAQPFEIHVLRASADAEDCNHQHSENRQNLFSQDSALSAVDKFGDSLRKITRGMPTTSHPQCNLSPPLDRPVIRTREDSKDTRSRFQCDEDRRVGFTPAVPTTGAMPSAFESELPAREKRSGVHINFQPELNALPFLHTGGLQDAGDGLPGSTMSCQGWIPFSQNVRCLPSVVGQFKAVEVGDRFLPKPLVEKFQVDPMDYWAFVNRFEVHVASRITDDDLRFAYVLQHCAKPVYEKLKHIAGNKNKSRAYREVWQGLYERCGQPHVISRCCERRLMEFPKAAISDADWLEDCSVLLKRCLASLEEVQSPTTIDSPAFVASIAGKLPLELKQEWVSCALTIQRQKGELAGFEKFVIGQSFKANSVYCNSCFPKLHKEEKRLQIKHVL